MDQKLMKGYRTTSWADFRRKVIECDDGACRRCGRSQADGITLHVHHKQYLPGRKPWDYPLDACETLCGGCHAAEHGKIPPKTGWDFLGVDDLGDLIGSCELCGNSIRYVFMVDHPNWHPMEVGTDCCDNLTSTEIASEFMESRRRHADRLKRFVSSKRWEERPKNTFRITQRRMDVVIIPVEGGFKIKIEGRTGARIFPDVFDAKKHAFEAIESGKVSAYFEAKKRERMKALMKSRY